MGRFCASILIGGLVPFGISWSQTAQQPVVRLDHTEADTPTYQSRTELAAISFRFLPERHRRPGPLQPEDVEILEDGVPQRVALLEGGDIPQPRISVDVILLFDCTPSFRPYINLNMLQPGLLDELENARISIYGFSDFVYRLIKPSGNMEDLQKAMNEIPLIPAVRIGPGDPIRETMHAAVQVPGSHPRILVIFTGPQTGVCQRLLRVSEETVRVAKELGIALYPVAVIPQSPGTADASVSGRRAFREPVPKSNSFASARSFLALGEATGGRGFARLAMPSAIVSEVTRQIRLQTKGEYSAGYYPSVSDDPSRRHRMSSTVPSPISV